MPHLLPAAASALAPAAAATAAKATVIGTLKSVAFNALTSLAISSALSVFSPTVGASARQVEFVIDPDGPIPFAAGRVGVSGSVVHRDTFGPDLMYYGIPFVLSGAGPITAIESFMADDYPMAFDANGGAVTEPYRQELFFRSVLGFQPAPVALSTPGGLKKGATLPGWTGAHKLSGKAAGLIVMAENSKGSAFPTGEIKPLIQLLGLKGWDPTQDSTYPGGSGPCRLHDASTWVTLTCPILWGLKWALGLWEGPTLKGAPAHDSLTDHQVGGIGARLSGIDVPAFVAASNIAKANAWTVSAYPNTDDDKYQVLETFLQTGGATYSQRAGKISCISRAAPRASLVTISARDTAGPLEIDTAASRIDRINTLRPRFWSPAHRWQMTAMDGEVTAQSYRDEDGGRTRSRGIDFPFVSDAKQAGQLAALQIANTREGIAGVIPLKPHLQRIRPGDAFTITEPGFVLNGLKCLCLNTDYDAATGVVRVSFVSETDGKYPFALGQNPTPPTPQVLTPVDPRFVTPPLPGDWVITPRPPSQGGAQQPGFDLTGFVSNETATAIIVETGPSANGPWTQAYQGPPTVKSIPIDGLQPGATYFVAIQYQRNQNYSDRYVYGPFTAPDLIAGDLSPESPVRIAVTEITERLVGVEGISAANAAAVADLEEVYGDTVSSAQNAAVAAEKASQAILAQAGAVAAEQGALSAKSDSVAAAGASASSASQAGGFKTAAEAASAAATEQKLQAQAARDEAGAKAAASALSAANASASETQAGVQAAASQTAKNAAEAARGQAETYRNETATARDTAQGAAATATAQAGLSASSAGASQAAANSPLATSPALSPDAFLVNSWQTLNGPPNLRQVFADNPGKIYPINSTVEVNTYGAGFHINTAKALPRPDGHRFRYSATVQRKVDAGTAEQNKVTLFAWFWGANGGSLGGWEFYSVNPGTSSGPVTLTAEHAPPAGTAWTRTLVRVFSTVGVTAILSLDTQDIEFERTATAAATASVASASVASTKADEAGASAAAANAAKVAAEIARDGANGSAGASATSASQALAYRNQAGEFASSSSGSANQAATSAGQSLAYRDQSAASSAEAVSAAARAGTSANNAGQSEYNAYQNYVGAAAAAATAVEQASTAGAHAASASISANLAASISAPRGQLLYNSTGNQGMDGWAGGPNWYAQDIGYGFGRGFRCGISGSYFYNDSSHFAGIAPESWVTWSADPKVFGGTCDLWLEFYDGGLNRIGGIYAQRQVSDRDFGDPISGEVLAPPGAFNARLVVLPTFSSGGSAGVRRMKVERGRLPATAWSDEETTKALAAQLKITADVAADAQTRLANVIFEVTGAAGGDPFDISLKAGPAGSDASITATKVRLRNIVNGEAVEALRIENGKSKFFGDVEVNGGSMNFNNRFIVAQDGTTTIRSGQTGERMWIEGKTIKGWYANGQQAYQLG